MQTSENGRFRHRKTSYAPVSNSALQDPKLSLKAKGLYALIQSYINIPNFDLYKWYLMKNCVEGDKAFDGACRELKDKGYLKQYRSPGEHRGRWAYEYELLDTAEPSTPSMITLRRDGTPAVKKSSNTAGDEDPDGPDDATVPEPQNDNTASGLDSDHTPKKGGMVNQVSESPDLNSDHTPLLAPYAQSTVCSEHPVLNGGDKNYTESNKTELNYNQSIYPSSAETDGSTDSNELRERLKDQIEYDYFMANYPENRKGIDILLDCMVEMLTAPTTKINGYPQERDTLQTYIDKADSIAVREFLEHMQKQPMKDVANITAYWRSSFINFLPDRELVQMTL